MKKLIQIFLCAVLILILAGFGILAYYTNNRADLSVWHTAVLDEEYEASTASEVKDLTAYFKLEDRLFAQMDEEIHARIPRAEQTRFNRYASGSWSDPNTFKKNWNRSFELPAGNPRAGVLLLHGLSDSPYSLRSLGLKLNEKEIWVVGLRLPGHGTAPAGLADVKWQDFSSAVRMAVRHIKNKIGVQNPFYIIGYSNGATLSLEYTLAAMQDDKMAKPAGMILISPAVTVSKTAAFAKYGLWLSRIPGLEKMAWTSIMPEFDPYKYNSFPINAGEQIYQLTRLVAKRIEQLDQGQKIKDFPPVLAFQSVVDATIPADGVVKKLLIHLAPNNHQLVLFDLNREAEMADLFSNDPIDKIKALQTAELPFQLTVVTNRNPQTLSVNAQIKQAMEETITTKDLPLKWPNDIYSLSHVALPFPPKDPLYGYKSKGREDKVLSLGDIELRGEKALLKVPIDHFMRLRYNPFYDYLEQRSLSFLMKNE